MVSSPEIISNSETPLYPATTPEASFALSESTLRSLCDLGEVLRAIHDRLMNEVRMDQDTLEVRAPIPNHHDSGNKE